MTYAPQTIAAAMAYWQAQGGVNLGIVGDAAHRARPSYHNGKDAIEQYGRTPATDYSIAHSRDQKGLTNGAAGMDLGKLHGTFVQLRAFSRWLVGVCQANPQARDLVREIVYSPDGMVVWRWDSYDNLIHTGPGNGDDSHLRHTHISFHRDTEKLDKRWLFEAYFTPGPPTDTEEEDMLDPSQDEPAAVCDVLPGGPLRAADKVTVLNPSWPGAKDVGLYARPKVTSGWAAIRIDRIGGPAEQLELAWTPNNRVTNVRVLGAPVDIKHKVALAVDGIVDPATEREV